MTRTMSSRRRPIHIHDTLARLEDGEIGAALVRPATSHAGTGWPRVDVEVNELRRHFQVAGTEQVAQAVKHHSAPTRRDAGIAADSVIQLVDILRRVDEDS